MISTSAGSRRIIAYVGDNGRSRLAPDERAPAIVEYQAMPGMRTSMLWQNKAAASIPNHADDPVPGLANTHPSIGESIFMTLTLPPDSIYVDPAFDPVAAAAEHARNAPGLAELMEPSAPGFHTTETIDYVIVLDGEVVLEVDDDSTRLHPGDCVVQLGSRHAWRNPTDRPATLAVVMLGAPRG